MKPAGPIGQEVRDELDFHVEMRTRELIAAGMTPAAARDEAIRRLGGLEGMQTRLTKLGRERDREIRRRYYVRALVQDFRYGLRQLLRQPGFALVAILTLGLAIGGTTAIFSVINATLLRPLPYPEPDRLVRLRDGSERFAEVSVAPGHVVEWQRRSRVFTAVAPYQQTFLTLTGRGDPQRLSTTRVTPALAEVLRVQPAAGRWFAEPDIAPGAPPVVVVSHGFWQRQFAGAPDAVGQSLTLSGVPATVIGIMPEGFAFPSRATEFWSPLVMDEEGWRNHGSHFLGAIARAREGVTMEAIREDLAVISRQLEEEFPGSNKGWFAVARWLDDDGVRDVEAALWLLAAAVACVMLIACANVAGLLLARGASRQRELSVRAALGAGRGRLVRQLLTESALLALAGAVVGVALAQALLGALVAAAPDALPDAGEVALDPAALGFALAIATLSPLLFGLLPSWQVSRARLAGVLGHGGRTASSPMGRRARTALIVGEVALAFVLLTGAVLLIRSFAALSSVSPGFEGANTVVARLSLPEARYETGAARGRFYDSLIERLEETPGIVAVGVSPSLPFFSDMFAVFFVEGQEPANPTDRTPTNFYAVNPGYFRAMGIPILRGRGIDASDTATSRRVVVVSDSLARRVFPDGDAIGQRIRVGQGPNPSFSEIVGVAADVRQYSLDEAEALIDLQVYEAAAQHPYFATRLLVLRTAGDPLSVVPRVRTVLNGIDGDVPISNVRTYEAALAASIGSARFTSRLLAGFAGVALLLAAVGLYGLLAYTVNQRTQEIGVRMAHGAVRGDIFRLMLGHGLRLALAGLALGAVLAFWATSLAGSMLYRVPPRDPVAFAVAALVLIGVTVAASALPARRATRVDPIVALRS